MSSESAEYLTPPWILDLVEKVAPIGLDPCGHLLSEATRRAKVACILPDKLPGAGGSDGLALDWTKELGFRVQYLVFVNPPYGRALNDWAAKMAAEKHCTIIALVPARVDTAWWRELDPSAWCALAGRVKFHTTDGLESANAAPFPSAVCLLHARPSSSTFARFIEAFKDAGPIYQRVQQ